MSFCKKMKIPFKTKGVYERKINPDKKLFKSNPIRKILKQVTLLSLIVLFFQNCHSLTFKLKDEWSITNYRFADISAMDEEMALEWIGKKAIINKQLYFEYQDIKSYKNIFKGDSFCAYRKSWTKEKVSTDSFLRYYRISAGELGMNRNEILIIHTACSGSPFHDIIVKSNNEIIVSWDGVFFTLTRKK